MRAARRAFVFLANDEGIRLGCAEAPAPGTAPRMGLGLALVAVIARLLLEDNAPGLRAVLAFPATRAVAGTDRRGY